MRKGICFLLVILLTFSLAGCFLVSARPDPSRDVTRPYSPTNMWGEPIESTDGNPPTETEPPATEPPERTLQSIVCCENGVKIEESFYTLDAAQRVIQLDTLRYDSSGHVTEAAGHSFVYDTRGNLIRHSHTQPPYGTVVSTFVYDSAGRLLSSHEASFEGWADTENTYNSAGQLVKSHVETQTEVADTDYLYDSMGLLVEENTVVNGYDYAYTHNIKLEYNARQQLIRKTTVTDASTRVQTYTYDAQGRLVEERSKTHDQTSVITYDYHYPLFDVQTDYFYEGANGMVYLNIYGWQQHFGAVQLTTDACGYIASAVNLNNGRVFYFIYDDTPAGSIPEPGTPDPVEPDPTQPPEAPRSPQDYTAEEIGILVENYFNTHFQSDENPGTYVVFHGETGISADKYYILVRFQAAEGDMNTPANVLVADVIYDRQTGVAIMDDYISTREIDLFA